MRSADGKSPDAQVAITAENIKDFLPSREKAATVRKIFVEAGFEVSGLVANSFSITGPVTLFEKFLKTRLRRETESGAVKAVRADKSATYELPLKALPEEATREVSAITFTAPPDFGPTNF